MESDPRATDDPGAVAPPGLPARLFALAAERPEEPWLFFQEGWHWRWRSWDRVAAAVGVLAAEIREGAASAGVAPGERIGFAGAVGVEAVALDLAVQAAGFAAAPLAAGDADGPGGQRAEAEASGCGALALVAGGGAGTASGGEPRPAGTRPPSHLPLILLPPTGLAAGAQPSTVGPRPAGAGVAVAGPVVVCERGIWRDFSQGELGASSASLERLLPPRPRRDVLVLTGSLAAPPVRVLWSWALITAAAVVLEPEPDRLVATAAWARPTLFAGDAAQRAALRGWLETTGRRRLADRLRPRRRPRLPLGRLHIVLATESAFPTDAERAAWAELGVTLLDRPVV